MRILPQASDDEVGGTSLGRLTLEKEFRGDMAARSQGEMLTATTGTEGSAGYVAIERVTGSLHGRDGSFVLQHCGIMSGASQQLTVMVVPDSGTRQLVGLSGKMAIKIVGGDHSYDFEYTLPDPTALQ
ncbi:MAG: DUF3224 domain-containing protein [Thermoplasmata archaeon]|nr:DUF3224 domain-containing protein [Thermoplasmata archaeon]